MYIDILYRLKDAVRRKGPENGEPTVSFSFTTMLQHTDRFWSSFSWQRTVWKHRSIPHTLLTWLNLILPVPSTEICVEGTALLWYCWRHACDGGDEKAFTKWLPKMFPTPLQSLAEVDCCTKGLLWRKFSGSYWTVLYSSEIKWFREHSEATTYYMVTSDCE